VEYGINYCVRYRVKIVGCKGDTAYDCEVDKVIFVTVFKKLDIIVIVLCHTFCSCVPEIGAKPAKGCMAEWQ